MDGASVMLDPGVTTSRAAEPAADEAVGFTTSLGMLEGRLWQAPGVDGPAPLLVVHDGPAYAGEGRLLDYLTRLAAGRLGREAIGVRVLLLTAPDRDRWYAANEEYAAALAQVVADATTTWPTTFTVGVGASLGALAMLHAQWRLGIFDGLLLQSGSLFTESTDPQEQGYSRWAEVTDFVDAAYTTRPPHPLPPIAMTCGENEENVANNRLMAARLGDLTEVTYVETPAVHNFPAWRDALHPSLADLLAAIRSPEGPAWPTIDP